MRVYLSTGQGTSRQGYVLSVDGLEVAELSLRDAVLDLEVSPSSEVQLQRSDGELMATLSPRAGGPTPAVLVFVTSLTGTPFLPFRAREDIRILVDPVTDPRSMIYRVSPVWATVKLVVAVTIVLLAYMWKSLNLPEEISTTVVIVSFLAAMTAFQDLIQRFRANRHNRAGSVPALRA